jgi:hypothetical protein
MLRPRPPSHSEQQRFPVAAVPGGPAA